MPLKVMSANAFQMGNSSKDNDRRLNLLFDIMLEENPDVIGFQEIWHEEDYESIFSEFKNKYDFFVDICPMKNIYSKMMNNFVAKKMTNFTISSGLVLMSKLELRHKEFISYSMNSLFEPVEKGIQKATIGYNSKDITLYNTHMAFNNLLAIPYKINELFLFKPQINMSKQSLIQKIQTNELKFVVNTNINSGIIMGDFNTFENWSDVIPEGFKVVSQIKESTRSSENKYSSANNNIAFKNKYVSDLIITSNNFECLENKLIKKPIISDHYIISSTLDF